MPDPKAPPTLPAPSDIPHVYIDTPWGGSWKAVPGTPEAAGPPGSFRRWWAKRKANR